MRIREFNKKDGYLVLKLISTILFEIFKEKPRNLKIGHYGKKEIFYVMEEKGKIIGTIAVKRHRNKISRLKKLYINKKYRKRGIAKKLLNMAIKFCKNQGYRKIILSTSPQMKDAIAFYKQNKFVQYRTNKKKNMIFFIRDII